MNLKDLCIRDNIPIVRDNTLKLIKEIIIKNNYSSILEIGSAYGYSAVCFSEIDCVNKIVSIEKNIENFKIAKQYENKKINFINGDAFEVFLNEKFDFIFIDGPKSHQGTLFDKYRNLLNDGGTIFIDNIYLKKFDSRKHLTKNQKNLLTKVTNFRNWLSELKDFNVDIKDIDDGIAIVTKK